jgi:hypothetical protein
MVGIIIVLGSSWFAGQSLLCIINIAEIRRARRWRRLIPKADAVTVLLSKTADDTANLAADIEAMRAGLA